MSGLYFQKYSSTLTEPLSVASRMHVVVVVTIQQAAIRIDVGWSILSVIGWTKSKRDLAKLNYYHKQIASLYGDGKLDENDMEALDRLRIELQMHIQKER